MTKLAGDRGFVGHIGISRRAGSFHLAALRDPALPGNSDDWPWASVTKQVVATIVMQQVAAGTLALDAPAAQYLPALGSEVAGPTLRQLLRHQSGLRNPDVSVADPAGLPSFYSTGATGLDWCLEGRIAPPADRWVYNNCDYIVLGAILEKVTGQPIDRLMEESIARPAGMTGTRFLHPDDQRPFMGADTDYRTRLSRYGSAGGLVGPLEDMVAFDRALLDGTLVSPSFREQLWAGDPSLGGMALGSWEFRALLAGCEAPVRIVERRGAIGHYQLRNLILPEQDLVLVLATEDGDFAFDEIWTGTGFLHDVLSLAACGAGR